MTPQEHEICELLEDGADVCKRLDGLSKTVERITNTNAKILKRTAKDLTAAMEEIAKLKEKAEMWESLAKEWLHEIHRKPALDDVRKFNTHIRAPAPVGIEYTHPGEYWIDLDRMADRIKITNGLEIVSTEEIARLHAEAVRVVVPELMESDLNDWSMDCDERDSFAEGYKLSASRAHSVPSSRVLKDGEVAVGEAELAALREFADGWSEFRSQFDDIQYHYSGMGCGIEDRGIHDRYAACEHGWECAMERVAERFPEIDTLDALRTQATATESGKAREVEG